MSNLENKIYIAGHSGLVGSSITRRLINKKADTIVYKSSNELDLTSQKQVENFFSKSKPDQVYLCAAKVGGIHANNSFPADFIFQNLMIQNNVINESFKSGVEKLLFLGSSCIYPRNSQQPIPESELLGSYLEKTNEPYAIAKIAGIKLCESLNRQYGKSHNIDYRSVMPTNLYGPGDNYHHENSHVIPSLLRRFHLAKKNQEKKVIVWGDGKPFREFLFVDDLSEACEFIMNIPQIELNKFTEPMCSHINIGSGQEYTIREIAEIIKEVVGFNGEIIFDKSKPNGTMRKLLDSNLINNLGWSAKTDIYSGLKITYKEFLKKNEQSN